MKDLQEGVVDQDLDLIIKALDAGADVNSADLAGRTPLWGAVAFENVEIALVIGSKCRNIDITVFHIPILVFYLVELCIEPPGIHVFSDYVPECLVL